MASRDFPRYTGPDTRALGRKMSLEEVRGRFEDQDASVYGQHIRRWLPGDRQMMQVMLDVAAPYLSAQDQARVLDLGAGTGRSALGMLQACDGCHVTLVDFSPNMLSAVPRMLAGFEGRYSVVQADLWEAEFPAGEFDVVVSSFALHHGRGEAVYGRLYRSAYRWIKPRGIFASCDVVEGDSPFLSMMNETGWRTYLRRKGIPREDVERLFINYRCEDSPLSLRQHLALLTAAGFQAADVLWKRLNFAVYVGLKDAGQGVRGPADSAKSF